MSSSPSDEPVLQLTSLPDVLVLHALGFVDPATLARCLAVSTKWSSLVRDDALWKSVCAEWFGLGACTFPASSANGGPATFIAAAACWSQLRAALGLPNEPCPRLAPLHLAATEAWGRISSWAQVHLPEAHDSIGPGASCHEWNEFLQQVDLDDEPDAAGLLPLRLLSSVHDGQHLSTDARTAAENGEVEDEELADALDDMSLEIDGDVGRQCFLGLLGGYSAYDTLVSVRPFPLVLIATWTLFFRRQWGPPTAPLGMPKHWLVVAGSFNLKKLLFYDVGTGELWIGPCARAPPGGRSVRRQTRVPVLRAVPESRADGADLLGWFGELGARLAGGDYVAEELVPLDPASRGLSLFPRAPPKLSSATSRGIRIVASALYCPELGMFTYSIRIALLGAGDPAHVPEAARGFRTAQLRSRRWIITQLDGTPEHVSGDGVVGRFPLLREGGWTEEAQTGPSLDSVRPDPYPGPESEKEGVFIYQSMSGRGPVASFEGEVTFVPGSLKEPAGEPFTVPVARFPLTCGVNEFIF
jgi:hypothetical protein